MKRELVLFFFLCLVGTSEMQVVSAATNIAADLPLLTQIQQALSSKELFDKFKSKFDSDGSLERMVRMVLPKAQPKDQELGAQTLIQQLDPTESIQGNKILFAAAGVMEVTVVVDRFFPAGHHEKLKKYIVTFLTFFSTVLWFIGFIMILDYDVTTGASSRNVGPMTLKVFAAAFFMLQPIARILRYKFDPEADSDEEHIFNYTNFIGIVLLFFANMISTSFVITTGPSTGKAGFFGKYYVLMALCLFTLGSGFLFATDALVTPHEQNTLKVKGYAVSGATLFLLACSFLVAGDFST